MAGSDIELDVSEVGRRVAGIAQAIEESKAVRSARDAQVTDTAVGRDFGDAAGRLNAALLRAQAASMARLHTMDETVRNIGLTMRALADADSQQVSRLRADGWS